MTIRQDDEDRYCLNDLHKAAGGEDRHRMNRWLALDQTHELILEIESGGIPPVSTVMGRNGGTFVVKELVYAYAMWISPKFHLAVIRAYDELQTQGVAVSDRMAQPLRSATSNTLTRAHLPQPQGLHLPLGNPVASLGSSLDP
ncbi:KilA-N domain-containing protein [Ectothiorhodospira variabilis]|uniref:KilA-N domain-containing protein n=1 Tax=Ectothiorhodospira variabilis TaxID=505694 RepID=UPI001EFBF2D5|nr:KilA-N domain-containing protein [Ectothiorhodospira variabilis]MCG5503114.1 KilA-N domain-containing protein [Ectothiorhodospira variabilis]MCG5506127.1 KilA-N domain-containing protein [Ectothiorhodospira variabilis]